MDGPRYAKKVWTTDTTITARQLCRGHEWDSLPSKMGTFANHPTSSQGLCVSHHRNIDVKNLQPFTKVVHE
jgi:hypothetical protein